MKNLKVLDTLSSGSRNTAIDIARAFAIIAVVLFHFNQTLPYGFIGVDLFFVISGFLIGGLLLKKVNNNEQVNYTRFILERGLKIWPSFYSFLFLGTLLAILFYSESHPDQIIPLDDMNRYVLFYQNYTGVPFHWTFDHVWSLCVEEHFYLILPLFFIITTNWNFIKSKNRFMFWGISAVIATGVFLRHISYFFTNGKDTYSATHNRIDALAMGVLLCLLIYNYKIQLNFKKSLLIMLSGILIVILTIFIHYSEKSLLFNKLYFHSLIPIGFAMIILGIYTFDFSRFKFLRFVAYYSYNWYLWHPIFVFIISDKIGNNITGLIVYLISSFTTAVIATIFIEEPILFKRKYLLDKVFGKFNAIKAGIGA